MKREQTTAMCRVFDQETKPRVGTSQAGFTLVELMASLLVFSVGMLGVHGLATAVIKQNSLATDISLASNLASSALEQLVITNYSAVNGTSPCPPADPVRDLECYYDKAGAPTTQAGRYFTRTWTATPDLANNVTDIVVRVEWNFNMSGSGTNVDSRFVVMNGRIYPR
jgi:prepilin-type N-terminal cleavage/methylation domain-containing protein